MAAQEAVIQNQIAIDKQAQAPQINAEGDQGTPEDPNVQQPLLRSQTSVFNPQLSRANIAVVQKRGLFMSQVVVVWSSQLLLSVLLTYEILSSSNIDSLAAYPSSQWIVVARFICAVVLHMAL